MYESYSLLSEFSEPIYYTMQAYFAGSNSTLPGLYCGLVLATSLFRKWEFYRRSRYSNRAFSTDFNRNPRHALTLVYHAFYMQVVLQVA